MNRRSQAGSTNVAGTLRVPSAYHGITTPRRRDQVAARRRSAVADGACLLHAFTIVEMLVAMAITLVMMGAVVTLFANVSNSIRNRRAVVELSGQMRHVRNVLQRDLQGATCTALTWRRPEHNEGYIEIIEGPRREGNASLLIDGQWPPTAANPEIDHTTSILPTTNLPINQPAGTTGDWVTDGGGLGDSDDILMLTVRNEHEPFVGRAPTAVRPDGNDPNPFGNWDSETIESPLAEVVWYSVENPGFTYDPAAGPTPGDVEPSAGGFFGEPGMRTVYRRTLLIAPWINPYRYIDTNGDVFDTFQLGGEQFTARPGLVRILPATVQQGNVPEALAALIAFQEAYDLSVRLEWDPLLGSVGRWKIVANTLGDLTKRENRYEHHFYNLRTGSRNYPFAVASTGSGHQDDDVTFVVDPELGGGNPAAATAHFSNDPVSDVGGLVATYTIDPANLNAATADRYIARPFAFIDDNNNIAPATARAILNDEGEVVRVVRGLVPLSGQRRGEDVMLTDVLGFDLRVYDPGAPIFGHVATETILEPTDPGWWRAYEHPDNMDAVDLSTGSGLIGNGQADFPFVGQGAYVDLGYGFIATRNPPTLPPPDYVNSSAIRPWFFVPQAMSDVYARSRPLDKLIFSQLAPGYAVYDTWSFHYENNGLNEDELRFDGSSWVEVDTLIDEGTNGLDDPGSYSDNFNVTRLGPDDVGERETAPPYDRPLRGIQVILRAYERDSRQIRQVTVGQSFVPE